MDTPTLVSAIRQHTRQSQEELAREVGVSFASVNAWENGRTEPRPVHRALLEQLAERLGILHHPVVLVIDDDPDSVTLVEATIERVDPTVQVVGASDGYRGLLLCGRLRPDILLIDVRMPHIDGFDVARALAHVDGLEDTAVYFLTAQVDAEVEATARSVGVRGVIAKPLTREDVSALLGVPVGSTTARS